MAWTNTTHVPTHMRNRILNRDNHTCQQCGATNTPLEVNHKTPLSQGGTTTPDNLETLCPPCHQPHTTHQTNQAKQARAQRGKKPLEQHPGML